MSLILVNDDFSGYFSRPGQHRADLDLSEPSQPEVPFLHWSGSCRNRETSSGRITGDLNKLFLLIVDSVQV